LFALHPLHVESVAWISERKDVLSTFFLMLAIYSYILYVEHPAVNRYLLVVLCFTLGLMSKPMLVTLPFVLLLLDLWPLNRVSLDQSDRSNNAQQRLTALGLVLEKIPLFVLAAVSFGVIRLIKHRPYFTVGWLWYLGTLVPVIGLVQVGGQAMADRYTYIPHIGLFIVIAWGAPELAAQWRHRKILLTALAIALLSILTAVTWKQAGYWKNSITLFEHTLAVTSNNWLSHNNLGAALSEQKRIDEAIKHYLEALRIKPDHVDGHYNLGAAFFAKGDIKDAIDHFRKVLKINPDDLNAKNNLKKLLLLQQQKS